MLVLSSTEFAERIEISGTSEKLPPGPLTALPAHRPLAAFSFLTSFLTFLAATVSSSSSSSPSPSSSSDNSIRVYVFACVLVCVLPSLNRLTCAATRRARFSSGSTEESVRRALHPATGHGVWPFSRWMISLIASPEKACGHFVLRSGQGQLVSNGAARGYGSRYSRLVRVLEDSERDRAVKVERRRAELDILVVGRFVSLLCGARSLEAISTHVGPPYEIRIPDAHRGAGSA